MDIGMCICKSPRSYLLFMLLLVKGQGDKGVIAP